MHLHLNRLSLCAVLALAAWAPAQAATSKAVASIDQFQFRLVDLDLNDGISPSLTITGQFLGLGSSGVGQWQGADTYGSTAVEHGLGNTRAVLSDSTVSAEASLHHPVPLDGSYYGFSSHSSRTVDFILSPHTSIIFSGIGTMSNERLAYLDRFDSSLRFDGRLLNEDSNTINEFDKNYYVGRGTATVNLNAMLTSDSVARAGRFTLRASAFLVGPVTTVPEPSSYAMLLAGVFVVGAVARRRRRAAAAPAA